MFTVPEPEWGYVVLLLLAARPPHHCRGARSWHYYRWHGPGRPTLEYSDQCDHYQSYSGLWCTLSIHLNVQIVQVLCIGNSYFSGIGFSTVQLKGHWLQSGKVINQHLTMLDFQISLHCPFLLNTAISIQPKILAKFYFDVWGGH